VASSTNGPRRGTLVTPMTNEEPLDDLRLHDATLEALSLDWGAGRAEAVFRTGTGTVLLQASGLARLVCPRMHPWGPSVSVNHVRGPQAQDGRSVLEIEMQSGDVIRSGPARHVALPPPLARSGGHSL